MQYTLEELEAKMTDLPLLPAVMFELCKADPDDVDFFDDLYRLACSDPSLASLILASANAASSSPNVHIHSLRAALTRIGSKSIYRLVALASVAKVFIPNQPQHRELWLHSVQVAILTSEIYKSVYGKGEAAELAYLCGLLHDIGRLVMFQFSPDIIEHIEKTEWCTPDDLIEVESVSLGYDHSSLGFLATQKMKLPTLICNIIRYHHSVKALTHEKVPKQMQKILLCLQVADAMSVYICRHRSWESLSVDQLKSDMFESVLKEDWSDIFPALDTIIKQLTEQMKNATEQAQALGI